MALCRRLVRLKTTSYAARTATMHVTALLGRHPSRMSLLNTDSTFAVLGVAPQLCEQRRITILWSMFFPQ